MSGFSSSSRSKAWMRSSNCPRYFVPATIDVMSRRSMRLLKSRGEVWRWAISCASPSTIALLPTPGSPIRIGLFFLRRHKISVTRFISFSLPTTGSSLPSAAALVRSVANLSSTGILPPLSATVVLVAALFLSPWVLFPDIIFSSSSSEMPIPFCGFEVVCIRCFIAVL